MEQHITLIIDKSGSMSKTDMKGMSRWAFMRETVFKIASQCDNHHPGQGLTLYTFSTAFIKHERVFAEDVNRIFDQETPNGTTNLHTVLTDALNAALTNRAQTNQRQLILVFTDGEPDNKPAVAKVISNASQKIEQEKDINIFFIQVGNDPAATEFLEKIDNDLLRHGARFDIVDVKPLAYIESLDFAEAVLA